MNITDPIGYYSLKDISLKNKIINVYNIPIVINYGNCDVI